VTAGAGAGLRGLLRAWAPALAWFGLISLLSAQPGLRVSDDPGTDLPLRRLAHLAVYGVLALLLLHALGGVRGRTRAGLPRALVALGCVALLGGIDELHQAFVPDRSGRLMDVALDTAGGALAIGAALLLARRRGARSRAGAADPPAGISRGG